MCALQVFDQFSFNGNGQADMRTFQIPKIKQQAALGAAAAHGGGGAVATNSFYGSGGLRFPSSAISDG